MKITALRAVSCLGLLFAAGCGPSPREVLDEYRGRCSKKRDQLKQFADKLPPKGSIRPAPLKQPLNPPLTLKKDASGNTESLMYEHMLDPKARPKFDIALNSNLTTALFWMTSEPSSQGDPDFMRRTLQSAVDAKYLIVHRVAQITLPKALGPSRFSTGGAVIENFLLDAETGEILGQFVVVARTAKQVRFSFKETDSAEDRMQAFAKSSMWSDARKKIAAELRKLTSGTVAVE